MHNYCILCDELKNKIKNMPRNTLFNYTNYRFRIITVFFALHTGRNQIQTLGIKINSVLSNLYIILYSIITDIFSIY